MEEAERQWFFWFAHETYRLSEVRAKLRASVGLCPPHSRRLLGRGHDRVPTVVYGDVVAGGPSGA
jgi:hypothetical protein